MTREEILNKHLGVSAEYIKNTLPSLQEEIFKAMSEYAEQDSKEFSVWCGINAVKFLEGDEWYYPKHGAYVPTSQLYQIFKFQQNATTK